MRNILILSLFIVSACTTTVHEHPTDQHNDSPVEVTSDYLPGYEEVGPMLEEGMSAIEENESVT